MINAGRLASVASVVSNPVEPESAFGCSTWNMDEPARSRQNGRTQTPELVTRGLFHTTNATDTADPSTECGQRSHARANTLHAPAARARKCRLRSDTGVAACGSRKHRG